MTGTRRILAAIALLALAGMMISAVSLYHHYGTSTSSFCDLGETLNCDIVNRSTYSEILGIPVALIGIGGYALVLALATLYRARAETPAFLLAASLAGLGFALYLTYVEGFILGIWCILCLSSLSMILVIAILSLLLFGRKVRQG